LWTRLTLSAHDQALARSGKSITAGDVLKAITDLDFGPADELVPLLEQELAGEYLHAARGTTSSLSHSLQPPTSQSLLAQLLFLLPVLDHAAVDSPCIMVTNHSRFDSIPSEPTSIEIEQNEVGSTWTRKTTSIKCHGAGDRGRAR